MAEDTGMEQTPQTVIAALVSIDEHGHILIHRNADDKLGAWVGNTTGVLGSAAEGRELACSILAASKVMTAREFVGV